MICKKFYVLQNLLGKFSLVMETEPGILIQAKKTCFKLSALGMKLPPAPRSSYERHSLSNHRVLAPQPNGINITFINRDPHFLPVFFKHTVVGNSKLGHLSCCCDLRVLEEKNEKDAASSPARVVRLRDHHCVLPVFPPHNLLLNNCFILHLCIIQATWIQASVCSFRTKKPQI